MHFAASANKDWLGRTQLFGLQHVPGLVINATAMRTVTLQDGLVEAGGGALFGDMLAALCNIRAGGETGRYTITHGRCRDVGLSADLMGGGWALDSPYAGMGCDAVRGGGGNRGFATKWWLKPIQVEKVTVFFGTWRFSDNAQSVFRTLVTRARRGTGQDGRRYHGVDDVLDDQEPVALSDQAQMSSSMAHSMSSMRFSGMRSP